MGARRPGSDGASAGIGRPTPARCGPGTVEPNGPGEPVGVERALTLDTREAEIDDQRHLVGGDAEVLPLLVVLGIAAVALG